MQPIRIALLASAILLALSACQKPAEPTTESPAPATTPTEAPTEAAPAAEAPASEAAAALAAADLAGTFSATLPCASCPGIDTTLTLNADGGYQLKEIYQDEKDGTFESAGKWALANGIITLTPEKTGDTAKHFAVDAKDAFTMVGPDGKRAESGLSYTLKRL